MNTKAISLEHDHSDGTSDGPDIGRIGAFILASLAVVGVLFTITPLALALTGFLPLLHERLFGKSG